jgi:hypothetical protein
MNLFTSAHRFGAAPLLDPRDVPCIIPRAVPHLAAHPINQCMHHKRAACHRLDDLQSWVLSLGRAISEFFKQAPLPLVLKHRGDIHPDTIRAGVTHAANGSPAMHPSARGAIHRCSADRSKGGKPNHRREDPDQRPDSNSNPAVTHTRNTPTLVSSRHTHVVIVISMNVGNSLLAFGEKSDRTLKNSLEEAEYVHADIVMIQEHLLDPISTNSIPYLESQKEWEWIAAPAVKEGQRGLGFLYRDYVRIISMKTSLVDKYEAILLMAEIEGVITACINIYWASPNTAAIITERCKAIGVLVTEASARGAQLIIVAGDTNENIMLAPNTRTDALFNGLHDISHDLVRLDATTEERMAWITRPRSGSHIDMLCCMHANSGIISCTAAWNHLWGNDDHSSLGVRITIRTSHTQVVGEEKPPVWHLLRFKWEGTTDEQKALYATKLLDILNSGIHERLTYHDTLANGSLYGTPTAILSREAKVALCNADACLLAASLHRGVRDAGFQAIPHKPPANQSKKPWGAPRRWRHLGGCASRSLQTSKSLDWQLINMLRKAMKQKTKSSSSVHVSRMVDDPSSPGNKHNVKEYGSAAVAAAIKRHITGTSMFDLSDPKFDNDFAREVEDAVAQIHASESLPTNTDHLPKPPPPRSQLSFRHLSAPLRRRAV